MFGALRAGDAGAAGALADLARDFSPRVERCADGVVVLDLDGLSRLFGDPYAIGRELRHAAVERGVRARIVIAGTCTAARLLALADDLPSDTPSAPPRVLEATPADRADADARGDVTVVAPGLEAEALAPLPIAVLAGMDVEPLAPDGDAGGHAQVATFARWGLRTLGELAALPAAAMAARLGRGGVRWRRLARGEDLRPLRPTPADERFEAQLDLEWPIDGLEPLSFVLGRLLDPVTAHLERRGRGAVALHLRLHLVTRAVHERSLQLPAPMRDARTFRTLLLLDLESHPPPAAIDRVMVAVDPTPARVLQFSLLARPLPAPEQLSTLTARLTALMGEGRCGAPALVDSWRPGAHAIVPFAPRDPTGSGPGVREAAESGTGGQHAAPPLRPVRRGSLPQGGEPARPAVALRRFRTPVPASVRVEEGRPVRVSTGRSEVRGGRVEACAGPWRTSGAWWGGAAPASPRLRSAADRRPRPWDRDEWDVTLAGDVTCRLFRDRQSDAWFVEGIVD